MEIFKNPEIKNLFEILFEKLLDESGRGAILIATAQIEEYLKELIIVCLPLEFSKKDEKRLFNYPGNLSSFSSKIELSYAFRLINKNLYDSLNKLRQIRNEAAHSNLKFDLNNLNEKMQDVYNLGPNIPNVIKSMATELMVGAKLISIKSLFDEMNLSYTEKNEKLQEMLENPSNIEVIKRQIPHWELMIGICIIAGMIINSKENFIKITDKIDTWDKLIKQVE